LSHKASSDQLENALAIWMDQRTQQHLATRTTHLGTGNPSRENNGPSEGCLENSANPAQKQGPTTSTAKGQYFSTGLSDLANKNTHTQLNVNFRQMYTLKN
jgi:hypothetical protein